MSQLSNLEASTSSQFISAIFNSKVPEGLKVTEYEWENEYRGTDKAFIESGLIKPEWVPGQHGNPKLKVVVGVVNGDMTVLPKGGSATNDQFDNGFMIIRRSRKGRLAVSIYCLKKEREIREKAGNLERAKKSIDVARREMDKDIAALPLSPADYVARELHTIRSLTRVLRNSLIDGFGYSGGYQFPADLVTKFDIAVARSIQMIKDAPIDFNEEKRQKEIVGIRKLVLAKYHGLTDKDLEQ